jgi:3-phenylpropionate/trans-cinnamate dioxygenase ferredoxin subunit
MGKIIVGKTSDFTPGKIQKATIDGKDIIVVNIDGNYYAVNDTCTHAGASLSEGSLDGQIITCGWHGAKFDCKTGNLSGFPVKIKDLNSYKVIVESENIFVEI